MSIEKFNRISASIHGKLSGLSNTSNEQCIFKVHDRLRNYNKEAYEPQVLSIGPYHRGKCNLKEMETHKLRYMQKLLLRRKEENADRYISALMELKGRARRCYAEEISLSENDFVEMLCLDGIFIIEFLRKPHRCGLRKRDDKIFVMHWLVKSIVRDLMLFENQIPFFVLAKLFDMTKFRDEGHSLITLALSVCEVPFHKSGSCTSISPDEVNHLLDLLHKSWCSSFHATFKEITEVKTKDPIDDFSLALKSASQLRQSGIKFERATQLASWLHITFENGKIKIPHLTVEDDTESIFRNLIAFEQYMTDSGSRKFVTDYVSFLDDLINSPRDVEILCHYGILTNWLGDDEVVATMFNKLVRDVTFDSDKFCYSKVYEDLNEHAKKRWNIRKANLMRNYFNTPWSVISFLAAVVLLILTAVQTIFSILQVCKN